MVSWSDWRLRKEPVSNSRGADDGMRLEDTWLQKLVKTCGITKAGGTLQNAEKECSLQRYLIRCGQCTDHTRLAYLHCLDHTCCRQTCCREGPSHFSSRHNSYHQQVCLYTSSSTRSITRSNINHVVSFRVCSPTVTSHSLFLLFLFWI